MEFAAAEPNFAKKFTADSSACSAQLHRLVARLAPALAPCDEEAVSSLPAEYGLGVVTTPKGFALRCRPVRRDQIAFKARPEEALAYGELFSLKREDCSLYIVHGVDGMA